MQKRELVQIPHLSEQMAGEFCFNYIEFFIWIYNVVVWFCFFLIIEHSSLYTLSAI